LVELVALLSTENVPSTKSTPGLLAITFSEKLRKLARVDGRHHRYNVVLLPVVSATCGASGPFEAVALVENQKWIGGSAPSARAATIESIVGMRSASVRMMIAGPRRSQGSPLKTIVPSHRFVAGRKFA
jgi:hypothetical protein